MNAIDTFLGYLNDSSIDTDNVIHLTPIPNTEASSTEPAEASETAVTPEPVVIPKHPADERRSSKKYDSKICRACNKPFVPEHALQKYCKRDHYRPCPVCGELLPAPYLSDPARRCKACAHKKIEDALQTAVDITYSCSQGQDKSFATYGQQSEGEEKTPAISYNDIESNLTFKYTSDKHIYRCKESDGVFVQDEIYTIYCKKGHGCYFAIDEEKGIRREFKSMYDFRDTFVEVEKVEI